MLNSLPGIQRSSATLRCNGLPVALWTLNDFENPVHFARIFGSRNTMVAIELTMAESFATAAVKPARLALTPQCEGLSVRFFWQTESFCAIEIDGSKRFILFFEEAPAQPADATLLDVSEVDTTGATVVTSALQQALDCCAAQGGGTLLLPDGIYQIGTLQLRSGVTLHLQAGTVLLGSDNPDDYPQDAAAGHEGMVRRLIYCQDCEDVGLSGTGIIYGRGAQLRGGPCGTNNLIRFVRCKNVSISDVLLLDSPKWTTHLLVCEQVNITGLKTINEIPVLDKTLAFHPGNNTDGINPDGCKNVRISRCFMHCGDDCFVIKASGASGVATEVSENISVQECMAYSFAAGIKIGTETRCRTIRNISFDAIDMVKVGTFITISIWDWAQVSNCTISNMRCEEAHHMSLDIALRRRKEDQPAIGSCRNLVLENIAIAHSQRGVLHGYDAQHQFENVVVRALVIEGRQLDTFDGTGIERNEFFGAIDFDSSVR